MKPILCAQCGGQIHNFEKTFVCPQCQSYYCSNCTTNFQYFPQHFLDKNYICSNCQLKQFPKLTNNSNVVNLFPNISKLSHVRVIQRNLVYVFGLPVSLAHDDILRKYEYFGQYGPIKKIVINTSHIHPEKLNDLKENASTNLSVTVYVTFQNSKDALECIYALDGFVLDGVQMKASFGTTKYCSYFLKGQRCTNPDCMFLHYCGEQSESFSKEEITGSCSRFISTTRPTLPPDYENSPKMNWRATVFPPRRVLMKSSMRSNNNINSKSIEAILANPAPLSGTVIVLAEVQTNHSLNYLLGLIDPSPRSIYYSLLNNTNNSNNTNNNV